MFRRVIFVFCSGLIACASSGENSPIDDKCAVPTPAGSIPPVFIALSRDFAGYLSWPIGAWHEQVSGGAALFSPHIGHADVYINRLPPAGSDSFPVGTVIVKVLLPDATTTTAGQVLGMVKRGGGFNSSGATDWEWFEIVGGDCQPNILWRGNGPPAGEGYGKSGVTCNSCHGLARNNDFVQTSGLKLKK